MEERGDGGLKVSVGDWGRKRKLNNTNVTIGKAYGYSKEVCTRILK